MYTYIHIYIHTHTHTHTHTHMYLCIYRESNAHLRRTRQAYFWSVACSIPWPTPEERVRVCIWVCYWRYNAHRHTTDTRYLDPLLKSEFVSPPSGRGGMVSTIIHVIWGGGYMLIGLGTYLAHLTYVFFLDFFFWRGSMVSTIIFIGLGTYLAHLTYVCVCVCVCVSVCLCVSLYVYIHKHTHTDTHTHLPPHTGSG